MKINRTFIVVVIVIAIIGIAMQIQMPKRFNWTISYSKYDPNPFGCMLFDSVLSKSMPNGYKAEGTTIYRNLDSAGVCNLLIVNSGMNFDSLTTVSIDKLTKQGSKIMIVAGDMYNYDNGDLDIGTVVSSEGYFDINTIRKEIGDKQNIMDSVFYNGFNHYPAHKYKILQPLLNYSDVALGDSDRHQKINWNILAYANYRNDSGGIERVPIVFSRKMNKGELYFVTCNLVFTNYGMLEGETSGFIMRTMSLIADKPIIRISNDNETEGNYEEGSTPFRAIFKVRALTWAFYLTLAVLLLFFIFTARRRQRAIPVIQPPRNHTVEFTKLIGTLFFQRHDYSELVRRKWELFAAAIRQNVGVDVQALDDDDTLFTRLSYRTGMTYEEIAKTIKQLRLIVLNENEITPEEMKRAINKMNEILDKTK